ncbi:hypothetical protein QJS10_CPB17g00167 [Acorus calamus]|uniref:DNA-directed RNA polymerase n=1 Tax=Acorus calamus TaxID=4465 RepID=A0AAV9CTI1_ACOCL|nr:hypothetical protein QJS10_CPB17g00167 [Acorus calamus]
MSSRAPSLQFNGYLTHNPRIITSHRRRQQVKTRIILRSHRNPSPSLPFLRWVIANSLPSPSFPPGFDPPDADRPSGVASYQLGLLQSPLVADPDEEIDEDRTFGLGSIGRIFEEDPPWFSPAFAVVEFDVRRRYDALRRRQIEAETEAWESATEEYREMEREMMEKKLAPNLPYVKSLFLGWFEPFRDAILKEQVLQVEKKQKAAYATHIGLLPADKMAVIVMHKMMRLLMTGEDEGSVRVVQAAVHVGEAIESEVRIHTFLKNTSFRETGTLEDKEREILQKRIAKLLRKNSLIEVRKLMRNQNNFEPWGRDAQAKLGSRLIELLLESAYVQPPVDQLADAPPEIRPAFRHLLKRMAKHDGTRFGYRYGVIECDPLVHSGFDSSARHMVVPYMPMLIPPQKWEGYNNGGYLFLPSHVMRTHGSRPQQDAIKSAPRKQLQKVYEALNTLGSTRWRVNKRVLSVVQNLWNRGGGIAGLVERADIPLPGKPNSEDATEISKWWWSVKKAKKMNRERHAQRCDIELKLSVAQKLRDEDEFYYPHNVDFRGRAYPMHSHLNHLNSDLCRGVLEFAEGRPLGKSGLHWLKIHLANLYAGGVDKLSNDMRVAFVEDNLDNIFDSAERPIDGKGWWLNADDPFQCLAACMDLCDALKNSLPYRAISHLPIHQDGSCNGLQHYAALGRDTMEAAAVNLVAGDKPADVYSGIADRVRDTMERDMKKDPATNPYASLAKILFDQVDRKLVKQTVMTSVYGVTYVGAREQIKRRLMERSFITDDRLLFSASCYAAKVILTALEEMFRAARGIKRWLNDCAKLIASQNKAVGWTTPLGLPVIQPYMKTERHLIKTTLQVLALQRESRSVLMKRQKMAFPPNFVHSLDGSHMMMTAIACRKAGLQFAGVHDSFWTHACDVDQMNHILREQFVELYSIPVLENLLESFQASFPTLDFPPLPTRGDFDLREVLESPYFFN